VGRTLYRKMFIFDPFGKDFLFVFLLASKERRKEKRRKEKRREKEQLEEERERLFS
jgi:hypothetical protein